MNCKLKCVCIYSLSILTVLLMLSGIVLQCVDFGNEITNLAVPTAAVGVGAITGGVAIGLAHKHGYNSATWVSSIFLFLMIGAVLVSIFSSQIFGTGFSVTMNFFISACVLIGGGLFLTGTMVNVNRQRSRENLIEKVCAYKLGNKVAYEKEEAGKFSKAEIEEIWAEGKKLADKRRKPIEKEDHVKYPSKKVLSLETDEYLLADGWTKEWNVATKKAYYQHEDGRCQMEKPVAAEDCSSSKYWKADILPASDLEEPTEESKDPFAALKDTQNKRLRRRLSKLLAA